MSVVGPNAKAHKDLIKCLEKKQAIMERLAEIKERVTNLPSSYLSQAFQEHIGIVLTYYDLRDHFGTSDKVYFIPYAGRLFPTIPWDEAELFDFDPSPRRETYHIHRNLDKILAYLTPVKEIWTERKFFGDNVQVGEDFRDFYHWYVVKEADAQGDSEKTHCTLRVLQYTEPEELLMRSEVLSAVTYMMHKLMYKCYKDQTIFPVLITSIFPSKVRILQVYFDGEDLHFSKTHIYDLRENHHHTYTLLARWGYPIPCGDLKTVNIRGRKLSAAVMEQVEDWKEEQEAMNMDDSPDK
ncbi:hypothetical protein BO83DRAFT_427101 [Aspergillus eucalypticola CBS 122712]|uniref:Uncharacterized protein n=1 Tax=Aspergillus eucalypticola (strain CBS 122712 / IBT 29274) TaxID=1448314 RepID=A0A317VJM7_ASPEC|nr:uncharacterized protein BO83DRAFT_427101 [Aspergillus eucalypticola CBS 122712]PWY73451.1 hypothetical protein BO83DRAFT_427101 [Aspergillus eucalypticola CBS 122712]